MLDLGLGHLVEELARVGRKTFDVAALSLGIERVEGERTLAAAREAGDDRDFPVRNRDGDVFQIILANPHQSDFAFFQDSSILNR